MIELTINNRNISVEPGTTILKAAQTIDIHIPTLCYLEGCDTFTSCMICVVLNRKTGQLIPACSVRVEQGMEIDTECDEVIQAQRDTLNMLLSEHVGDCEGPCSRACPAHMDIPLMIRQIQNRDWSSAIETVKQDIALPAVLGRICPAPCEAGCNRKHHDASVSICLLKRFVADRDLKSHHPYRPEIQKSSEKTIGIVGAGPTGLAAAYYLAQKGHRIHLYDQNNKPGGQLRSISDEKLPKDVLDSEMEQIFKLSVEFRSGQRLGESIGLEALRNEYDAIVLATGVGNLNFYQKSGLDFNQKGIVIDRKTYLTNLAGVFAGGNAISESNRTVRSVAHGKEMAVAIDQYVLGMEVTGERQIFDSRMGKPSAYEVIELLKDATEEKRRIPVNELNGFDEVQACDEAARCFHCNCRKPDTCKLRNYSDQLDANQSIYKIGQRPEMTRKIHPGNVIFESGKCIRCGLCIQIAKKFGEEFGFAFVGRGFDVRVDIPFHENLENGLRKAADACIDACPTAAISRHE